MVLQSKKKWSELFACLVIHQDIENLEGFIKSTGAIDDLFFFYLVRRYTNDFLMYSIRNGEKSATKTKQTKQKIPPEVFATTPLQKKCVCRYLLILISYYKTCLKEILLNFNKKSLLLSIKFVSSVSYYEWDTMFSMIILL